jgi:hypothetical protein
VRVACETEYEERQKKERKNSSQFFLFVVFCEFSPPRKLVILNYFLRVLYYILYIQTDFRYFRFTLVAS